MGNTGSQGGHSNQRAPAEEHQWAHSFPRTQPQKLNQLKVLPDRDAKIKLRPTNNGEILQAGGTLTGRQHAIKSIVEKNGSDQRADESISPLQRTYLSNQRYSMHKLGYKSNHHIQNKSIASQKQQMKLFGSEPDLRYSSNVSSDNEMKERRIKKKYKAPPPPNFRLNCNLRNEWENSEEFPKRARLFKTRAETKKQNSSHVNNTLENFESVSTKNEEGKPSNTDLKLRPNRFSMPELKLAEREDFQKEIKEATQRLRIIKNENAQNSKYNLGQNNNSEKEKLKTLDPNKDIFKKKLKQIVELEENNNIINAANFTREEPSGKESSTPEHSPNLKDKTRDRPKTFYFGMDEVPNYRKDHNSVTKIIHSSESDISSDLELDENHAPNGDIDLQLRPILPKKQLEIPRFSPAAAWKLLSAVENKTGTIASDDLPVFIEERIEKYARPPPPNVQIGQRSNNDKSGDSGISGDAGPVGFDENIDMSFNSRSNLPGNSYFDRHDHLSWTPQQDLGDDSSLEDLENDSPAYKRRPHVNRPHVFSLSLPRENQLAAYMIEKSSLQYSGLQKLKRSVSGVLNNLSNNKKDLTQSNLNEDDGSNWFFSKSAPNSLNNGFNSLEHRTSNDSDAIFSAPVSTNRVMYLPELREHKQNEVKQQRRSRDESSEKKYKLSVYSKSCEDLIVETKKEPETLQDPPKEFEFPWAQPSKKPKKFTFQSTVRQIERRRMAEKLSREAEKKEQQRLRELEAMQRVEEEFQKKRAKEKADIRQQLRLAALDDKVMWTSLPPNLELKEERQEPDGAFSSSTSSSSPPPQKPQGVKMPVKKDSKVSDKVKAVATQELSEFRQFQRDYKEFRGITKYTADSKYPKQTTVHPQITCNMPKAKGNKVVNGNYRKEFAFGVKYTRSVDGTHSEDSQTNSPKMYHNKYTPVTRF